MIQQQPDSAAEEKRRVQLILSGNSKAFRDFIEDNQQLVFSITGRILNNPSDTADICQDIFLKAFTGLASFRFDSKLSTWLARIAYTTCINHIQKARPYLQDNTNLSMEEQDDEKQITNHQQVDINSGPEEQLFNRELKLRLQTEIEKLPVVMRTIILLFHQEEMSYLEIASVMNMPAGTVKSHLFRARSLLKKQFLQSVKREDL